MFMHLRIAALALITATSVTSWGHGILPDEIPMAAGTALRAPGPLPALALTFEQNWSPASLTLQQREARLITITNLSADWHLFALVDNQALRDQQQIHRLMPDLRKDYPNTRLSEPGTTTTLPWRFDKAGDFVLRCVRAEHQAYSPALSLRVLPVATMPEPSNLFSRPGR